MDLRSLAIILVVGAIAGWLAGLAMKGRGFGLAGNIIVGVLGALVGGWLLGVLGITLGGGWPAAIARAFLGAVVVLAVIGLIRKA